ncbi:MAG: polyphosphate kinase 2, partial [Planctomycetota bacterium]
MPPSPDMPSTKTEKPAKSKNKKQKAASNGKVPDAPPADGKLSGKVYAKELARLQVELVKMQEWIKATGYRAVVLFEGRDAAGKGGAIKR